MTETTNELVDERVQVYGDPTVTCGQIAGMWSAYTGADIKATDVPLMLAQMKMVRAKQAPDYSDNSDDIDGYVDIFKKIVGDDMVHARSVDEYVNIKRGIRASRGVLPHEIDDQDPEAWRCTGCDWGKTKVPSFVNDRLFAGVAHAEFHGALR